MLFRWTGAGLAAIGLAMLLFGIYFVYLGDEVGNWPETTGTVESTRVRIWSPTSNQSASQRRRADLHEYYPEVRYTWTVGGRAYEGRRYILGTTHPKFDEREDAVDAAKNFPAGSSIPVYYDPNHPSQAVLDPSRDWFALFVPSVLGLVFFASGWSLFRFAPQLEAASQRSASGSNQP